MSKAVARVREEIRGLLVVAVFFSIGFTLIHLSNRLLTLGSGVEISSLSRAVIGGFIAAKVLFTVDLLPFVDAFPRKPLIYNVVWKSALYSVAALIFMYIEPFFRSLFRGKGLAASHSLAFHVFALPRTWAVEIWVAMLLTAFVTLKELSQVLGQDEFKYMFVGHRGQWVKNTSVRDAA
jgi:hypothetical protein